MKKVFVVDDNNANLFTAQKALSNHYNVFTLPSAAAMLELLEDVMPDLLLLDIMMPDMDGFEALSVLRSNKNYAEIPVIFLTGQIDANTEVRGFEMGAIDFIHKPFSEPVLLNRIKSHLEIESLIRDRTEKLRQRTTKLKRLQNSMVSVLANMVDNRDNLTGKHIERTAKYIRILLEDMVRSGTYYNEIIRWNPESATASDLDKTRPENNGELNLDDVISSARLHDIGKIVVSDLILNKPGKLTTEEYDKIKLHAIEGEKIIDSIIAESGDEIFLQNAKLFAGSHHERWDGNGYPRGFKGDEIPLQGRVMAVADVYDALVSERPYKKAFSHERAVEIILEGKGSQFDPQIVDIFVGVSEKFRSVHSDGGATVSGEI